jgi:hypothetical protein
MAPKKEPNRKTIVFVSYAHEDAPFASALKDWLEDSLLGSINVFVSSHRANVQYGDVWFDNVRENLRRAAICICLVSPHSIERRWLYFESGAAFLKEIPVVPICLGGVKIKDLQQPLNFSEALELPDQEGESSLLTMVAKAANLKPPQKPNALSLPKFDYFLSSDLQFSEENLAAYERSFEGQAIWVVTANLDHDVLNGPMAGPVTYNLERGVTYTYVVPRKDDNKLKADIESIKNAYNQRKIPPEFVYLKSEYFDIIETNITIYNPIANLGRPTEVFFELPIDSDPKKRRWIKMEDTFAKRLVVRMRPLIEETKVGGGAPEGG